MLRGVVCAAGCLVLGACNNLTVREATLSNNQTVAMVSTPGDGVSPPANVVLIKDRRGNFVPVATGFGQAPVPALLNGAVAGAAIGGGMYGAAAARRPNNVNVSTSTSAFGGGGTGFGGTGIGTGGSAFSF